MVCIRTPMEPSIKASGNKTSSTEKVMNNGLTVQSIQEITSLGRKTERDILNGQTIHRIMVNLLIMILMGLVSIAGQTKGCTKASGWLIKCTVKASLHGLTAESTRVNTSMTKSRVKECSIGLMEGRMMEPG